jgi:hypothetical protein
LKLPQLLSQFLYQNKTLALPGIGVFTLASTFSVPELQIEGQPQTVQGISYRQELVQKPGAELIDFLHKYTGKMKPLAESDLESYLQLGIQLLNIGKPFHFEGIGSIIKNKEDRYEFVPGEYSTVKLTLPSEEKTEMAEKRKKVLDAPEKEYSPQSKTAKGILLMIGIIGGIAVIAWAGYSLYKKKTVASGDDTGSELVLKKDSAQLAKSDTSVTGIQPAPTPGKKDSVSILQKHGDTAMYKFVILSTTNKNRALKRFNQLRSFELSVKMDTKDSSFFKVYFPIYTLPRDTLHIKDSLSDYYATKTTIEQ